MARVSIYVSDELKARMAEAGDALNWSDIARPAFETALAAFNHRKGQNMQTAIERLRASKVQHKQEQESSGKECGRLWAMNKAEFAELERIDAIDLSLFGNGVNHIWQDIRSAIDPHDTLDTSELSMALFGEDEDYEEDWLIAWVEGVQEFYAEVANEI